ncbi:Uncharacterised protein [Mycobacteroides abscessus]|nr:Uncharacterised protein [Mycobacteroides abscessus]
MSRRKASGSALGSGAPGRSRPRARASARASTAIVRPALSSRARTASSASRWLSTSG